MFLAGAVRPVGSGTALQGVSLITRPLLSWSPGSFDEREGLGPEVSSATSAHGEGGSVSGTSLLLVGRGPASARGQQLGEGLRAGGDPPVL